MKKKNLLLIVMLLAVSIGMGAQTPSEVLSKLTFEAPSALYAPKGQTANLRQQPNTKARKVKIYDNAESNWIPANYIVNDEGDNQAWVTTHVEGKPVYISKSVMQKLDPQPFMANKVQNTGRMWQSNFDYDDFFGDTFWRVGKVKGNSGLWICKGNCYDGKKFLRLGKMVGNVLVFKYCIYFEYHEQPEWVNKWNVESEIANGDYNSIYEGKKVYYLLASPDFTIDDRTEGEALNLTKITEPMAYALFKEVIDRNETNYYYLCSYSFDKRWDVPDTSHPVD